MIRQMVEDLQQTTLAQAIRMLSAAGLALTLFWSYAGQFIKPYVGDAIGQVMIEQGVAPNDFKEALESIQDIKKTLVETHQVMEQRGNILADLAAGQKSVIAQNVQDGIRQDATDKKLDRIYDAIIGNQLEGFKPRR